MKTENRLLAAVKKLLAEKLPEEQANELRVEGFGIKAPTRQTALAIALYKKAEKGDLSAIRELRAILDADEKLSSGKDGTVVIIDDLPKTPV